MWDTFFGFIIIAFVRFSSVIFAVISRAYSIKPLVLEHSTLPFTGLYFPVSTSEISMSKTGATNSQEQDPYLPIVSFNFCYRLDTWFLL